MRRAPMISWITIFVVTLPLIVWSCAKSSYERGTHPTGFTRYDVEGDYKECEFKARMSNDQHFPFGPGLQTSADHARALHNLSAITAMRDTCLAAKGYKVE